MGYCKDGMRFKQMIYFSSYATLGQHFNSEMYQPLVQFSNCGEFSSKTPFLVNTSVERGKNKTKLPLFPQWNVESGQGERAGYLQHKNIYCSRKYINSDMRSKRSYNPNRKIFGIKIGINHPSHSE